MHVGQKLATLVSCHTIDLIVKGGIGSRATHVLHRVKLEVDACSHPLQLHSTHIRVFPRPCFPQEHNLSVIGVVIGGGEHKVITLGQRISLAPCLIAHCIPQL